MMEAMMDVVTVYAPYFAAGLLSLAAIGAYGLYQVQEMEKKKRFYHFAAPEIDDGLAAAERLLRNSDTPEVIRSAVLLMLKTLTSPELGKMFIHFAPTAHRNDRKAKSSNPLSEAMERLHAENPDLAADAHAALMSVSLLAIPLKYADEIEIEEIVVSETVKAATSPDTVFDRLGIISKKFNTEAIKTKEIFATC